MQPTQKVSLNRSRKPRPSGFTLVELMVVIAIIALLVSILIPVVGRARRQSRNVACLANLRSLQIAFTGYINTNHHSFFYLDPANRSGQLFTWEGNLKPMYNVENVRLCAEAFEPENRGDGYGSATLAYGVKTSQGPSSVMAVTAPAPGTPTTTNRSFGSYGFNGFLYRIDEDQRDYQNKLSKVAIWGGSGNTSIVSPTTNYHKYWFDDPLTLDGGDIPPTVTASPGVVIPPGFGSAGSVPLFGDCNYLDAWPESSGPAAAQHDPTPKTGGYVTSTGDRTPTPAGITKSSDHNLGRFCLDRHPGGVNIVFLDGHARTVSLPELWKLRWNKSFVPVAVTVP